MRVSRYRFSTRTLIHCCGPSLTAAKMRGMAIEWYAWLWQTAARGTRAYQVGLLVLASSFSVQAQSKPDKDYLAYVVSESADKIALIRFGPNGARIDHQLDTGDMPVDIDGPK